MLTDPPIIDVVALEGKLTAYVKASVARLHMNTTGKAKRTPALTLSKKHRKSVRDPHIHAKIDVVITYLFFKWPSPLVAINARNKIRKILKVMKMNS